MLSSNISLLNTFGSPSPLSPESKSTLNVSVWVEPAGIVACRRFGPQNPQLWVTALQYVASSGAEVPPPHHFKEVLESIEQHRLLSPLLVVSTLSTCPTATLGVVR